MYDVPMMFGEMGHLTHLARWGYGGDIDDDKGGGVGGGMGNVLDIPME